MPRQTALQIVEHVVKPKRGHTKAIRESRSHVPTLKKGINTSSKAMAALIDIDKPLTDMQRTFVKLWASGESVTTASIRAGYQDGGSYGYRMTAQPNILKFYNEEKAAFERVSDMSRKKVMDMLLEAYADAKMVNEPASMVSAAREIGRMCGYYEPVKHRIEVNHSGNVILDRMNRLSDAELLDLITKED